MYAIIAIATYYASGLVFGILLGIIDLIFDLNIDWDNAFGLNLIGIPIGIAVDYGLYVILKKKWEKEKVNPKDEIQDIGNSIENQEE